MADRRAVKVPHVPGEGGGNQPRSSNKDGRWRGKARVEYPPDPGVPDPELRQEDGVDVTDV